MTFKCECCGLEVKKIGLWKEGECPDDAYQHHFKKIKRDK